MMERFQCILRGADSSARLPAAWAYRLYGWLLEQLPEETAALLHDPAGHPLSQFLRYDHVRQQNIWTLNLLDEAAAAQIKPLLLSSQEIALHGATLQISVPSVAPLVNAEQLLLAARQSPSRRAALYFLTPCAFKQAGRYAIWPQESLLLHSLVRQWNAVFLDYALTDPDALEAILYGLRIIRYDLHTAVYPLKGTKIPGFVGSAVVEARLALPLLELWNALLRFAPYGGIGIKTTLGMGGAEVAFPETPEAQLRP